MEVLISVAILSLALIGATAIQTTSLRSTSKASGVERALTIARAELEYQRRLTSRASGNCGTQ